LHPLARFDLRAPVAWLVPLAVSMAFTLLLVNGQDRALFLAVNAWGVHTNPTLWANITVLGNTVVALALALPLWRRRPDLVWAAAIAGVLATGWVHLLKPIAHAPRPPAVLGAQVHLIGPGFRLGSFPSGHSTTAFALAGLLALGLAPVFDNRSAKRPQAERASQHRAAASRSSPAAPWLAMTVALVAGASLVALSRCVVGVHWPRDLLAGAFGGWLAAALGLEAARRTLTFGTGTRVQNALGLLLAGCAVALVGGYDSGYHEAIGFQRALGVVCLASAVLTWWPGVNAVAHTHPLLASGHDEGRTESTR
jgi:membrane-associated phospholipid phosphatase